jgi:hypothetical protein
MPGWLDLGFGLEIASQMAKTMIDTGSGFSYMTMSRMRDAGRAEGDLNYMEVSRDELIELTEL